MLIISQITEKKLLIFIISKVFKIMKRGILEAILQTTKINISFDYYVIYGSPSIIFFLFHSGTKQNQKCGSDGIRTHASEETRT